MTSRQSVLPVSSLIARNRFPVVAEVKIWLRLGSELKFEAGRANWQERDG
jgi:hypothetical protein